MKTINAVLVLGLLFPSMAVVAQNVEYSSNLTYGRATGNMARNIDDAFGITFGLAKNFKSAFSLGAEIGLGSYGNETNRQSYTFDDGSVTETDVVVSNDITTLSLTGKYFFRNNMKVNPYVSGKAGWSWFTTTLRIEDPADQFSCEPVESAILSRDNTYSVSAGAGLRVDFKTFFKNMDDQRFYFDLNIHHTQGGSIRYMNADKDPAHPAPDEDVMAKFINTQTQIVHEHHVGYVYSSMLSMMEYKFGVVFRP